MNGEQVSDSESFEEISESDLMELQAHKSPISDTSDTLTYGSLNSQLENDQKDFLENYVLGKTIKQYFSRVTTFCHFLDSDTDTDATKVPLFTQETCTTPQTFSENVHSRVSTFISNLKGHFERFVPKKVPSRAVRVLDVERPRSTIEEFKQISVPKDPFISPFLASDDMLRKLPAVKILVRNKMWRLIVVMRRFFRRSNWIHVSMTV